MEFINGIDRKKKALHARTRKNFCAISMSERTGMSISQVTDEVLYTCLVEMQELPELE